VHSRLNQLARNFPGGQARAVRSSLASQSREIVKGKGRLTTSHRIRRWQTTCPTDVGNP